MAVQFGEPGVRDGLNRCSDEVVRHGHAEDRPVSAVQFADAAARGGDGRGARDTGSYRRRSAGPGTRGAAGHTRGGPRPLQRLHLSGGAASMAAVCCRPGCAQLSIAQALPAR